MIVPRITLPENEYSRMVHYTTRSNPEYHYRELERIKTGTWFFGIFNTYKYEWSEWKTDKALKEKNTP